MIRRVSAIQCRCGFTCGTETAFEKHVARGCSAGKKQDGEVPQPAQPAVEVSPAGARVRTKPRVPEEVSELSSRMRTLVLENATGAGTHVMLTVPLEQEVSFRAC